MSGIAFAPEEFGEALKDFEGQIVAVDYADEPFGMKGAPGIQRTGKVLCTKIRTDAYEKDQFEWYPPSNVKKTKWAYFIEALNETGAMRDVDTAGKTGDEQMQSFAKSLLGMKFRYQERECESLVKEKGGAQKKFNLLVPVEYLGKAAIEEAPRVRQTTVGEAVSETGTGEPVDIDKAMQPRADIE